MRYAIVSGSHRLESQSIKVSKWLAKALERRKHKTDIIDLAEDAVPILNQAVLEGASDLSKKMKPSLKKIATADGIILVAPEWGSMVATGMKNFLTYVGSEHAAHKPTLLVGVSSNRGGAYPISDLRMSGNNNSRMVYIPDYLIVQDVNNVLNDHDMKSKNTNDIYIKKRALYSLDVLDAYTKTLKEMRKTQDLLDEKYPFGM